MLEMAPATLALALAGGYLLGSIPFGLLLTSGAGLGDVRKIGSGNIGATNVLRTGRKDLAALTLLLDGAKGAVAVLLAAHFLGFQAALVAALGAFLGHLFPVWLGFKGGKGVATFIGVELALAWPVGLLICATWALTAAVLRMSSLAALVAAALTPVFAWWIAGLQHAILSVVLVVLIFIRHHENIRRLIAGTEPKIGGSKKSSQTS